jgi:hypothetical protein
MKKLDSKHNITPPLVGEYGTVTTDDQITPLSFASQQQDNSSVSPPYPIIQQFQSETVFTCRTRHPNTQLKCQNKVELRNDRHFFYYNHGAKTLIPQIVGGTIRTYVCERNTDAVHSYELCLPNNPLSVKEHSQNINIPSENTELLFIQFQVKISKLIS